MRGGGDSVPMTVTVPQSRSTHNDRLNQVLLAHSSEARAVEIHYMNNGTRDLETPLTGPQDFQSCALPVLPSRAVQRERSRGQWESHRKNRVIISFQKQGSSKLALSSYCFLMSKI